MKLDNPVAADEIQVIDAGLSSSLRERDAKTSMQIPLALRAARVVVVAGSAVALGTFIVLAFMRIGYRYELEWLESEVLNHVHRLVNGDGLYGAPSVLHTQVPYSPLSFGFGALLSEIFGSHFWVMRALSIAATVGAFTLLYRIVYEDTRSHFGGIVAAGLYAASFRLTGTFFDVAKPDALMMFFAIASIGMARLDRRWWQSALAGVLMALAIATKQTAIFFFVPVAGYLLVTKWRSGVAFAATTTLITLVSTAVLNVVSHGWYMFFTWELLFQHPLVDTSKFAFFTKDLRSYWPAVLVIAIGALQWARRKHWWHTGYFAFAFAGLIAGAWTSRLHAGGYDNVLMPAALAIALATGFAIGRLQLRAKFVLVPMAAMVLCMTQLYFLRYDPGAQLPSAADRRAGDMLISHLASINGDVLVVAHPGYADMAGKRPFAGRGGMEDVLRGKDVVAKRDLETSLADAIHTRRFGAIVLDIDEDAGGFPSDWKSYYRLSDESPVPPGTFRPVVNKTGAPSQVWLPAFPK